MQRIGRIKLIIPFVALAVAVFFAVSLVSGLLQLSAANFIRVSSFAGQTPVIIIDPGHGGVDGGAVGAQGILEKDINLEISFILRDLFVLNGFEVVMTREEDISIHDPDAKTIRQKKRSDLHNRLEITERYTENIFISIHQNKFGDSAQRGTQVFYGPNHPGSELLALTLQRNVATMLQPENRREHKQGSDNLFLIYNTRSPAILVECGFLSNPEDTRNLSDPEYQARLAFAIFGSVMEYLGMQLPESQV